MTVKPSQFDLLQQLLSFSEVRHRVISQNLANVNTPGYRRLDVSFDESLKQALAGGSQAGAADLGREIQEAEGLATRADGNNVDIDREIGALNSNAMRYQTYAQVLANRLSTMRSAIAGR